MHTWPPCRWNIWCGTYPRTDYVFLSTFFRHLVKTTPSATTRRPLPLGMRRSCLLSTIDPFHVSGNAANLEYRTIRFFYKSENFFCFVLQIGCIPTVVEGVYGLLSLDQSRNKIMGQYKASNVGDVVQFVFERKHTFEFICQTAH